MSRTGLAESVIEDEVGCGRFQILVILTVFFPLRFSAVFTFIFMSYGNYNPGWRCLDNNTLYQDYKLNNESLYQSLQTPSNTSVEYSKDFTCQEYEACQRVEFNPESSTVVTEWGLICDRAWISSFLISIQMAGNLSASFLAGYVADRIGRWKTIYGAVFLTSLLHLLSSFSVSWQTLAACRFCVGFISAFFEPLIYVYSSEFLTRRWRGPLSGIHAWSVGGIVFGVMSMILRDWRHILVASSAVCMLTCLPALWIPESLRWLEVRGRMNEFQKAAKKMANFNKKELREKQTEVFSLNEKTTASSYQNKQKHYTILDIFHDGYKMITLIVGFLWLSLSFIYYAISFGIKTLSGDFYINIIMLYSIVIPFAIFPFFAPNLLGRKKASCLCMFLTSVCLFVATIFECETTGFSRMIGTLVLVLMAEVGIETAWCIQQAHTSEIYPTVVRGIALNWACLMARIGGICAPFLIPNDSSTVYTWYLMMACLGLVCCCLLARLPETRGKALKETFSVVSLDISIKADGEDTDASYGDHKVVYIDKKKEVENVNGEAENDVA